jgi:hypothetical protein
MNDQNEEQGPRLTVDVEKLHHGDTSLVELIYKRIRNVEAYTLEELDALRPEGTSDRDWNLAIHGAETRLLGEGVVFLTQSGSGVRRRAKNAKQAINKAARQAKRGLKSMTRTILTVAAAAPLADDPEERRRIERLELKRANQVVAAKHAIRSASRPRPKGV